MFGGGKRDRFVREIGSGNDDRVDVRIGTEGFVIGRDVIATPVGAALVEELAAGVADAGQAGTGIDADGGNVVIITDRAGTDDGDADGIGGRVFWHEAVKETSDCGCGCPVSQKGPRSSAGDESAYKA